MEKKGNDDEVPSESSQVMVRECYGIVLTTMGGIVYESMDHRMKCSARNSK